MNWLANLWYPRLKRTTPTLPEFGGNSLSGYNTERGAFRKDMLMPEIFKSRSLVVRCSVVWFAEALPHEQAPRTSFASRTTKRSGPHRLEA